MQATPLSPAALLALAVALALALRTTVAATTVQHLNPWLSACDLDASGATTRADADVDAAARRICAEGARALHAARLPHCNERALLPALDARARHHALAGGERCTRALRDLLALDALAAVASSDLADILARYDCQQNFSVINTCADCQKVYRRWVCSSLVPLFASAAVLKHPGPIGASMGQQVPGEGEGPGRGQASLKSDASLLARRARTLYSIDTYSGYLPNDRNTNLNNNKNNNNDYKNNNNNNNYYNNNVNKYDDLLLFVNDERDPFFESAGVAYDYNDYERDRSTDEGSASFYNSVSSNMTFYNMLIARDGVIGLWDENVVNRTESTRPKPYSKRGNTRPEQNVIETRKDLDNRLEAHHSTTTSSAGGARSRREGPREQEQFYRIKPCLAVCQDVEQACPYFLPGDRAPSYPTQYAGEPTFLCLDPNIPETGEQLLKSNYGMPECCYTHCGSQGDEICHKCTVLPPQEQPYAPSCGSPPITNSVTSSASVLSSPSVIIFFTSIFNILNNKYNKIVLFELNIYYFKPVNIVIFDNIWYFIKKSIKIIPSTRL